VASFWDAVKCPEELKISKLTNRCSWKMMKMNILTSFSSSSFPCKSACCYGSCALFANTFTQVTRPEACHSPLFSHEPAV